MKPGPTKGVPFRWDTAEVLKLCVYANDHGMSMANTVAERYGISSQNARMRISRLRQMGYDVPSQLGWNGQEPHGCGSAAGYQRHLRLGEQTCDACRAHNNARIRAYRQTGTSANTPTFIPPSTVLAFQCDCGAWADSIEALRRHTWGCHGREASKLERTPR